MKNFISFRTTSYVQLVKKKEKKNNTSIYFTTNYRREMKLVSIIMDYCLLQFDALKFFLGVYLHGGSQLNFNFFNVNPQIFQRNRKAHLTNCLETSFHDISILSLRVIRRRNYSYCEVLNIIGVKKLNEEIINFIRFPYI